MEAVYLLPLAGTQKFEEVPKCVFEVRERILQTANETPRYGDGYVRVSGGKTDIHLSRMSTNQMISVARYVGASRESVMHPVNPPPELVRLAPKTKRGKVRVMNTLTGQIY